MGRHVLSILSQNSVSRKCLTIPPPSYLRTICSISGCVVSNESITPPIFYLLTGHSLIIICTQSHSIYSRTWVCLDSKVLYLISVLVFIPTTSHLPQYNSLHHFICLKYFWEYSLLNEKVVGRDWTLSRVLQGISDVIITDFISIFMTLLMIKPDL